MTKSQLSEGEGSRYERFALIAVMLLGLLTRFSGLGEKSLWGDEIHRVEWVRRGLIWLVENRLRDLLAYLTIYAADLVSTRFSLGELGLRLPAALAGIGAIYAIYRLGKALFGPQEGLVSAFLMVFLPFYVRYSQDASQYTIVALFCILSLYFLCKACEEGKVGWWVAFALVSVANLYSHVYTLFLLLAQTLAIGLLLARRIRSWATAIETTGKRPRLTALVHDLELQKPALSYALIGVLWLPVPLMASERLLGVVEPARIAVMIKPWMLAVGLLALGSVAAGVRIFPWRKVIDGIVAWIAITQKASRKHPIPAMLFSLVIGAFLVRLLAQHLLPLLFQPFLGVRGPGLWIYACFCLMGVAAALRDQRHKWIVFVLTASTIPSFAFELVIVYAYKARQGAPVSWPYHYRYLAFILPMYLLLIGRGVTVIAHALSTIAHRWMKNPTPTWGVSLVLAMMSFPTFTAPALWEQEVQKTEADWRGISAFLQTQVREGEDAVLGLPGRHLAFYYPHPIHFSDERLKLYLERARAKERAWLVWLPYSPQGTPDPRSATKMEAWLEEQGFIIIRWDRLLRLVLKDNLVKSEAQRLARKRTLLSAALEARPKDPELHAALAQVYNAEGKTESAIASYRTAAALTPLTPRYYWAIGRIYEEQGDLESAIAAYKLSNVQIASKLRAQSYNLMAQAYLKYGEFDLALEHYQLSLKHDKNLIASHIGIGSVYKAKGEITRAIEQYEKTAAAFPNDPRPLIALGQALSQSGQRQRATTALQEALAIDPARADAYLALADIYNRDYMYDKVIALFLQATAYVTDPFSRESLLPQCPDLCIRILEHQLAHDPGQSLAIDWEALLQFKHSAVRLYQELAQHYLARSEAAQALRAYEQAISVDPGFIEAYIASGELLEADGAYAQAEARYKHAVTLGDGAGVALFHLARLWDAQGRQHEALQAYTQVSAAHPDNVEYLLSAARAFVAAGDAASAIPYYERAVSFQPENLPARRELSSIYQKIGRLQDAIAQHERILELRPEVAYFHFELALLYQAIGQQTRMAEELRTYLELAPNGKLAAQAQEMLRSTAAQP